MTPDEITKARKTWEAVRRTDNITTQASMAALWASLHGERLLTIAEQFTEQYSDLPGNVLNLHALKPLYDAAGMAARALETADGGDPTTETGWRSEEYFEPYVALIEARALARDPDHVIKDSPPWNDDEKDHDS